MKRATLMLLVALAGCASTRGLQPHAELSQADSLAADKSLADASRGEWPALDWWKRFGDPQLDSLVEEGVSRSPNIRLSAARLDAARAQAVIAGVPLGAQVAGDASINRQRFSENYIFPAPIGGATFTTSQLDLSASYEVDFWGKNRAAYEAALGRARAAQAETFASQLVLSSAIASTYVQLARGYDQLDLARRTLEERQRIHSLTGDRVRAGLDSRLELKQVETSIPAARARVVQIEGEIALSRNQLAALLGQGPDRGLAIERPALHMTPVTLPPRVGADLIGRRPDIVAARVRAEAAARDIDAARRAFYPDINLTALIGVQSVTPSKLLEAGSAIPSIGAAIRLPILDAGRLRGNLAARDAEYDAAVEQYNQALADALREVVDQLASLRSVQAQRAESEAALASAEEAYELSVTRYKAGIGSLLQVISAETQVLDQRTLRADLNSRELALAINLVRALGGGFDVQVAMK
jgi:NodT family efflux transporter outer membrane factor (OMF) lipoprotein